MSDLDSLLRPAAERELLRYAVSQQMFCPVEGCGRILDVRRDVLITVALPAPDSADPIEREYCVCRHCLPAVAESLVDRFGARPLKISALVGRSKGGPKTEVAYDNTGPEPTGTHVDALAKRAQVARDAAATLLRGLRREFGRGLVFTALPGGWMEFSRDRYRARVRQAPFGVDLAPGETVTL